MLSTLVLKLVHHFLDILKKPRQSPGFIFLDHRIDLEAIEKGYHIAAVDASGTSNAVEEGRQGFLTPNDSGAPAQAIEKLVLDPDLRNIMGTHARSKVKEYDYMHQAQRLLSVRESNCTKNVYYRRDCCDGHRPDHLLPFEAKPGSSVLEKCAPGDIHNASVDLDQFLGSHAKIICSILLCSWIIFQKLLKKSIL